jgi:acyl-coenzyme A thioesterase PaaI-like protein
MIYKIRRRQFNAKNCIVCGLENEFGLKTRFYETVGNEVIAIFSTLNEHQGYPEVVHGGITSAILDETIGRAIIPLHNDKLWGVTVELTIKYRKPLPLKTELKAIGRVTDNNGRIFKGTGEIFLPNGEVAVSAEGKYLKVIMDKIVSSDFIINEWKLVSEENVPQEITIIDK